MHAVVCCNSWSLLVYLCSDASVQNFIPLQLTCNGYERAMQQFGPLFGGVCITGIGTISFTFSLSFVGRLSVLFIEGLR